MDGQQTGAQISLLMIKGVMHTCILFKYVLKRDSLGNFGSVVVDLLFCVPLIVCGGSALVFVLVCINLCPF